MNEYFLFNKNESWMNTNLLNAKEKYTSYKVVANILNEYSKYDWTVKIITKTDYDTKTYLCDLTKINNGKTFAHKGLPLWDDGTFVSDGYAHPFYRNVENAALDSILRNEVKCDEVWAGLMKSAEYNFTKVEDFGLVLIFIWEGSWWLWIKHNGFEIQEKLQEKNGSLVFQTTSKKILGV